MTIFVFTGPTLSPEEARNELDAVYLPPVSQGDVYRASLKLPHAIGIIDGYFNQVPAVWHKEILWAMTRGIHVFGSASMGALRAAELTSYGMEGVGKIFEAYRDGILEDDDEVALVHGPAEMNYIAMSEPMVNIRYTLAKAQAAGVLTPITRAALEGIAKETFFARRSYPLLLQHANERGLPKAELSVFKDWLLDGQMNQKREDALAMLRLMRERLLTNPAPKSVQFAFEHTEVWEQLKGSAGELLLDADTGAVTFFLESLLDELRLEGNSFVHSRKAAIARLLMLNEAWRQGIIIDADMLYEAVITFRRERGLLEPEDLERWMIEHHLNREEFIRLMEEEARLFRVETLLEADIERALPDHLRIVGQYKRLLERACDKQCVLESGGQQNPDLANAGLTEEELMHWYFLEHPACPPVTDISHYARSVGFDDKDAFRLAVLREFYYCKSKSSHQDTSAIEKASVAEDGFGA